MDFKPAGLCKVNAPATGFIAFSIIELSAVVIFPSESSTSTNGASINLAFAELLAGSMVALIAFDICALKSSTFSNTPSIAAVSVTVAELF